MYVPLRFAEPSKIPTTKSPGSKLTVHDIKIAPLCSFSYFHVMLSKLINMRDLGVLFALCVEHMVFKRTKIRNIR